MAGREYQILEPERTRKLALPGRRWDRAFLRAHELLTERNRVLQGILTHTANTLKVLTVDAKVRMLKVRTNEGSERNLLSNHRIAIQFEADDRNTMQHV
jgi:hypothetical protein